MAQETRLDDSGATPNECLLRVRALVQQAIDILDARGGPAEISARLQEVVDALNRFISGSD